MTRAHHCSSTRRLLFALSLLALPLLHAGPGATALAQAPATEAATPGPVVTDGWIDAQGDVDIPAILQSLDPDVRAYMAHITTLANPFFEGRSPDTHGNRVAADYIEFWFRHFGLQPAFPEYDSEGNVLGDADAWVSYRQPFDMPGGMEATRQELALVDGSGEKTTFTAGREFSALGVGQGEVGAPLAFVGYGIASGPDGQDHYGEIDLTGRIALLLRFEPSDAQGNSKWNDGKPEWTANASLETKLLEAARRGAAGIILVNPPGTFDGRASELMTAEESTWRRAGVPVVQMSIPAAERLVGQVAGKSLRELKREADEDSFKAANLDDRFTVSIATTLDRKHNWTDNVGGIIRGRGDLADEWIIIGAHYDHVGYGRFGSMAGRTAEGIIHPGADDNGSGTSAVLVLADRLSKAYAQLPADANMRSVLLMTFSAEESGLNGSRYYTRHPTLTAEQVNIMLNLDMVGRLRDNSLEVSGVGSATQLAEIVQPYFDESGLRIVSQQTGSGPSDHASFNAVGIPVLFFFTGLHPQYHRPADVASLINPVGAVKIVDLAQQIALEFARRPERLEYQKTSGGFRLDMLEQPPGAQAPAQPEPPTEPMPRVTVRLGIQPEYNAQGIGVHLAGVSDDTPAQAAGLQGGDVILSWNGSPVADIRALMTELAKHKPGDEVNLGVKRGEEMLEIKVKLAASDG
ncbi:MAG: M28 family peptidase [Phycisphaerales bacterium]|nr:M28 family peptidase [Phycisphaerales bacterium]